VSRWSGLDAGAVMFLHQSCGARGV